MFSSSDMNYLRQVASHFVICRLNGHDATIQSIVTGHEWIIISFFIGVGEAGSEAVLPLDAFYSYMDRAVNRIIAATGSGENAAVIYEAVKAGMQDADIGISLNGREFGRTLKGMGVSLA